MTIKVGGKEIMIDDEFKVDKYYFYLSGNGYVHVIHKKTKERELLHRVVLGFKKRDGKISDHINRNRSDNRRSNLRRVSQTQNVLNRSNRKKYRGIFVKRWGKSNIAYGAVLKVNYKAIHLGTYKTEEDAARAYDKEAIKRYGKNACLFINFPTDYKGKCGTITSNYVGV